MPELQRWGRGRGGRPWRRLRRSIFCRDQWLCQEHKRRGKLVTVTEHGENAGVCDHKVSLAHGGTDDPDNLETLCQECAERKDAADRGARPKDYSLAVGADGWPVDPAHPANGGEG